MYSRILVPLDGSTSAERVLPHVEALAAPFGAAVMLLRATTPDRTLIRPDADTMRAGEPIVHSSPMSEVERREAHIPCRCRTEAERA